MGNVVAVELTTVHSTGSRDGSHEDENIITIALDSCAEYVASFCLSPDESPTSLYLFRYVETSVRLFATRFVLRVPPKLPDDLATSLRREWLRKLRRTAGNIETNELAPDDLPASEYASYSLDDYHARKSRRSRAFSGYKESGN